MRVESLELLPANQSLLQEAAALDEDAREFDELAATARANEKRYVVLPSYLPEEERKKKELEYKRLREKYRNEASDAENNAGNCRAQAEAKRREARSPRHVITGWDGIRTVMLRTRIDLSKRFAEVSDGIFICWRGMRTEGSSDFEVWEVTYIELVDEPTNFADRPS